MEPTKVLMRIEDIGSRERVPEEHIVTVMLRVSGCADAPAASQFVSDRLRGLAERSRVLNIIENARHNITPPYLGMKTSVSTDDVIREVWNNALDWVSGEVKEKGTEQ